MEWHIPERFDVLIKDQMYEIRLVSRIPKRGGGKVREVRPIGRDLHRRRRLAVVSHGEHCE